MKYESEIVVNQILPALRKILAERLVHEYGFTQEEVAARLQITQPAVSQYLKGKRSNAEVVTKLEEDPQIQLILEEAASNAAKEEDYSKDFGEVIDTARAKGLFKEKFEDAGRLI